MKREIKPNMKTPKNQLKKNWYQNYHYPSSKSVTRNHSITGDETLSDFRFTIQIASQKIPNPCSITGPTNSP